ncbi:MAG: tetratricopeptide repeat protein [Planctomycetota bacterium]|jgi:tetratricopeptide (TPR) repeat protein
MLDFNLERLKRLPLQPGTTWQGGLFRVPAWVSDSGGAPSRPLMAIWLNHGEPRVSSPRYVLDEDPHEVALDALIEFAIDAGRKGHRPFAIKVKNPELAAFLEERLRGAGVRIDCVEALPEVQELLDEMAQELNQHEEPPSALSGKGVGIKQMRSFAEAAERFHEARLWEELSDEDLIDITRPAPPPGMRYASVLGHGGETFGLGFFASLKDYQKMYDASTPGQYLSKNGNWSLIFDDITELCLADADLWEDYDLPVAGPEAYPSAMWFGPKRQIRRPKANELAFLDGLLRALAETTTEDMDAGKWSRKVSVGGKSTAYQLALVNEVEAHAPSSQVPANPQHVRRAMEKGMANLQRLIAEHEFESLEEANAFFQANLNREDPVEAPPRTPMEQAQDIMYEAWDSAGRRRRTMAQKALDICPDCADAYVLLAEETSDAVKACELFRKGVEAGERSLGADVFANEVGHFWGILETRPYMRARFELAQLLWDLDQRAEAVSHYEDLLRLNPNDNQGVRYVLAACLLERGEDEKLGKLLQDYREDASAQWQYLHALSCYRREGDTSKARELAKQAVKTNQYVPDFLHGKRRLPKRIPDSYQLGEKSEAICCAYEIRTAWKATPGAVAWLKEVSPAR